MREDLLSGFAAAEIANGFDAFTVDVAVKRPELGVGVVARFDIGVGPSPICRNRDFIVIDIQGSYSLPEPMV